MMIKYFFSALLSVVAYHLFFRLIPIFSGEVDVENIHYIFFGMSYTVIVAIWATTLTLIGFALKVISVWFELAQQFIIPILIYVPVAYVLTVAGSDDLQIFSLKTIWLSSLLSILVYMVSIVGIERWSKVEQTLGDSQNNHK